MKKGWLIGSSLFLVLLIVIGSTVFQQRVEQSAEVGGVTPLDEEKVEEQDVVQANSDRNETEDKTETVDTTNRNTVYAAETADGDRMIIADDAKLADSNDTSKTSVGTDSAGTNNSNNSTNSNGTSETNGANGTGGSGQGKTGETGNQSDKETNNAPTSPQSNDSVTSIKNQYFPEFQRLEWEHQGKLDSLVQQAFDEYMDSEDGTVDAGKYRSRAEQLEASADAAFYAKYRQLQTELATNGHSKQAAQDFQASYEAKKAAQQSELKALMNN
ncbi:hypothetical protein [Bacillus solitudinis]|uniref:hypothetical protein n=1 Tax=Bacillus solitudinis TaxID=2014074 RepID=UPI000C234899|nr:hypothetical protein [Bacillus solitudinis]